MQNTEKIIAKYALGANLFRKQVESTNAKKIQPLDFFLFLFFSNLFNI